jgi:hypothetical protein
MGIVVGFFTEIASIECRLIGTYIGNSRDKQSPIKIPWSEANLRPEHFWIMCLIQITVC